MISQKVNLHNRFDFEILDTEIGTIEHAQAENLITNTGMTNVLNGGAIPFRIAVGTGTGTLDVTRTTLFSHLLELVSTVVETVYDTPTTGHFTSKAIFTETQANGVWTEVGFTNTGGSGLRTHAMITDAEGNPITINKTNTKIITVYATIYGELLPATNGVDMATGPANAILSALVTGSGVSTLSFVLTKKRTIDGNPSLWCNYAQIGTTEAYDLATLRRYTGVSRFGTTAGNGAVRGILVGNDDSSFTKVVGGFKIPDATMFPGHAFTGIAVGTGDGSTTQFDMPLDEILAESETIYIDGVAKTRGVDYNIHYGVRQSVTKVLDMPSKGSYNYYNAPGNPFSETIVLQDIDDAYYSASASTVTSVYINYVGGAISTIKLELSTDGITWVTVHDGAAPADSPTTYSSFPPDKYKYLRINATMTGTQSNMTYEYMHIASTPPANKHITFTTPPASAAAITADCSVDYIPKSENFVLDLQTEIVYGRG